MKVSRLSDKQARELLSALDTVLETESPFDALVKVSKEKDLTPGQIKLLVYAYNNGSVVNHIMTAPDVTTKAASIPIIKSEDVIAAVYPEKFEKTSSNEVSSDYNLSGKFFSEKAASQKPVRKPRTIKVASSVVPKPEIDEKTKAFFDKKRQEREIEKLASDYRITNEKIRSNIYQLYEYFTKFGSYSHDKVAVEVEAVYGNAGKKLMEAVQPKVKHASVKDEVIVNWKVPPFSFVKNIFDLSKTAAELGQQLQKKEAGNGHGPGQSTDSEDEKGESSGKSGGPGLLDKIVDFTVFKSIDKVMPGKRQGKGQPLDIPEKPKYEPPYHYPAAEAALTDIESKAVVYSLLNNDPIISNYPKEEVIRSYNMLLQIAPLASRQEAIAQQFLRKILEQGTLDTFTLSQLSKIESELVRSKQLAQESRFRKAQQDAALYY